MNHTSNKLLAAAAAAALAAVAAGAIALHATAAAQPAAKRLIFVERELGGPTADLGKHGFTALDRQVITSDILDLKGRVVGRSDDDCGVTAVGKRAGAVCSSAMTFRDGQIVGVRFDSFTGSDESAQPITGGSGAYVGAKGEVRALRKTKLGLEFEVDLVR